MRMFFATLRRVCEGASDVNVCKLALKRFSQVCFPDTLKPSLPHCTVDSGLENKCAAELQRSGHHRRSTPTKCRAAALLQTMTFTWSPMLLRAALPLPAFSLLSFNNQSHVTVNRTDGMPTVPGLWNKFRITA
jgi:hypothetical protein